MSADQQPTSADQQLLYETRVRNRQAAVAVTAGVLLMAASIVGLSGPHAKANELTLGLIVDHRRGALDIVAAVINAVASLAIAWTMVFLFRCAKARAPQAPGFIPIVAVIGGGVAAVAAVADAIVVSIKVQDFVTTGAQTYDEASRLTGGGGLLALQVAAQVASLLVAVAFVLVSLQAMRVGLLPRFMGYLGMFAGALILFPIIVVPVVQLYWLAALGYLISGRWPSGVPAAWRTGQAEPWPPSSELRAQRMAQGEANRARRRGGAVPSTATATEPPAPVDDAATNGESRTRSTTPKRKRKRRS